MAITLSGTNGIQNVLGSASAPADTNTTTPTTGVYYPSATTWGVSTAGTNALYIDASQNVGIGTTSPSSYFNAKTTVFGSSGTNRLTVANSGSTSSDASDLLVCANGTTYFLQNIIYGNGNASTQSNTTTTYTIGTAASAPLLFNTNNTERMRIDSSGNVGIGTTSPSGNLEVKGASGQNIYATYTGGSQLRMKSDSGDSGVGTTGSTPLLFLVANAEKTRIDTLGAFLIGTSSRGTTNSNSFTFQPGDAYSVFNHINGTSSGTSYINFGYNGAGIGSISQSGTTGVLYNVTSDQRLKTNVIDAPSASSIIDAIQIRSFDWKSDGSHNRYGVIAQELNQLVPEAVHTPVDEKEMMGVDYSKLVPHLIKYVQELKAEFDAYKAAHP